MKELDDCLVLLQDEIFACRFKQADEQFLRAIELMSAWAAGLAPNQLPEFNKVMTAILDAQQKVDYLLLADLVEYKLRPFLQKTGEIKGEQLL